MEIQSDCRDLLELFNKNSVEYVIVGGYALAFHGAPRYTGDLDIFVSVIAVYYIGREQFINNKRAVGRKKDLADLEALSKE
jgi:hypothetical protein